MSLSWKMYHMPGRALYLVCQSDEVACRCRDTARADLRCTPHKWACRETHNPGVPAVFNKPQNSQELIQFCYHICEFFGLQLAIRCQIDNTTLIIWGPRPKNNTTCSKMRKTKYIGTRISLDQITGLLSVCANGPFYSLATEKAVTGGLGNMGLSLSKTVLMQGADVVNIDLPESPEAEVWSELRSPNYPV